MALSPVSTEIMTIPFCAPALRRNASRIIENTLKRMLNEIDELKIYERLI